MRNFLVGLQLKLSDQVSGPLGNVRAAVDRVQQKLGGLEQTSRALNSYRALKERTEQTSLKMQQATQKVADLALKLKAVEQPSRKLQQQFDAAKRAAGALKQQHVSQIVELGNLSRAMNKAGLSTNNLAEAERRLAFRTAQAKKELQYQTGALETAERIERKRTLERQRRDARASSVGTGGGGGGRLRSAITSAAIAAGTGYGLVSMFNRLLVRPGADFESYTLRLTQLTGSAKNAQTALAWITTFAQKTPFEIDGLVGAFTRMKALGLDPLDGSLQAIADQTAKLGGGQMELDGIVLALGQAWTKQKLQGEEALQLMERGVPVWDLLARATGKNVPQLLKLSAAGKLGRDAIKALIEQMGKESLGTAESMSTTWAGMTSNLRDQWTRFRLMIMQAGLFDFLKNKLIGIMAQLDRMAASGALQKMAQLWSDRIVKVLSTLWDIVSALAPVFIGLLTAVNAVAQALGGYDKLLYVWLGGKVIAGVVGFTTSLAALALVAPVTAASLAPILLVALKITAAFAAAAAAGAAIGTLIAKLQNKTLSLLTGRDTTLGAFAYDLFNGDEGAAAEAPTPLQRRPRASGAALPTLDRSPAAARGGVIENRSTIRVVLEQNGRLRVAAVDAPDTDLSVQSGPFFPLMN